MKHRGVSFSRDPARPVPILRESEKAFLQGVTKFRRRHTCYFPENFREMTGVRVANIQCDLDQTARGFANELLSTRDPFSPDELQWSHARRLFEHARKMKRAKLDQLRQSFDQNLLGQMFHYVIVDLLKLA